jgi:voltage-gated potassium channel
MQVADPAARTLTPAGHRRQLLVGAARSVTTAAALVVLYYLLPLDHLARVPLAVTLVLGLLVLLAAAAWQLGLVLRASYPGMRAVEALATIVPLFLLLFASAYFVMARASPASFSTHPLTRTDSLYFTVTTFSTVGYGDITASSQDARLLVIGQIVLDLLALGAGLRVFIGAVQVARQARQDPGNPDVEVDQPRLHPE